MNNRQKRRILYIIIAVVIVLILMVTFALVHKSSTGILQITVAPTDSTITVDGENYELDEDNEIKLKTGQHEVIISHDGFDSQTRSVTISGNSTTSIAVALTSNSSTTSNWYTDNNNEETQKALEGQSSYDFDQQTSNLLEEYPILKYIPYTKYTNSGAVQWSIDAQWTSTGDIYRFEITAVSCVDNTTRLLLQDANDYLTSNGINLSDYDIAYFANCGSITKYTGEL